MLEPKPLAKTKGKFLKAHRPPVNSTCFQGLRIVSAKKRNKAEWLGDWGIRTYFFLYKLYVWSTDVRLDNASCCAPLFSQCCGTCFTLCGRLNMARRITWLILQILILPLLLAHIWLYHVAESRLGLSLDLLRSYMRFFILNYSIWVIVA